MFFIVGVCALELLLLVSADLVGCRQPSESEKSLAQPLPQRAVIRKQPQRLLKRRSGPFLV